MVACFECAGCLNMAVVAHQFRRVVVGLGVKKAIKSIKTAPQWPTVEWARGPGFSKWRNVPFADHIIAITNIAQ